jgi:putative endopeptidase
MQRMMRYGLAAALLAGCAASPSAPPMAANGNAAGRQAITKPFDRANLNEKVNACDDFFEFANGGWSAANPIPPAYPTWGITIQVGDQIRQDLRTILETASQNAGKRSSEEQKIGDLYASCMDEAAINAAGTGAIQPDLDRIARISDPASLVDEIAHLQTVGVSVPFRVGSRPDLKQSTDIIFSVGQGGLGLPERDYYFDSKERSKGIRDEYVKHVAAMFALAGDSAERAQAEAATVMAMETKLAEASLGRVALREPTASYHRMSVADAEALTPHIAWAKLMPGIGAPKVAELNVGNPKFLQEVDRQIVSTPIDDWRTYLRWHLIRSAATSLSDPFVQENFRFRSTVLNGVTEMQPRWKRCVNSVDASLGEALGKVYIAEKFPPTSKRQVMALIDNMVAALRDDIGTLSWMSPPTREAALRKLNAFQRKIAYPEKWRNYDDVKIVRNSYAVNALAVNQYELRRDLEKIGKPPDRTEWRMSPPTQNAYYNPSANEIVFPAGYLIWPMFDPNQDDAYNYGGIGSVIGHEMSHGFDDQGAKYDANGNLSNWWTDEDLKNFQAKTDCIVKQFNGYEVEPGVAHNGKLVVGESVGDLGGITLAYAAYKKSLQGKPDPGLLDGFTADQRFFLGYARARLRNPTPAAARMQVATDPHPVGRFRVNGPLSNMPTFASAFGCKTGDPMVRAEADRCQIW